MNKHGKINVTRPPVQKVALPEEDQFYSTPQYTVVQGNQDYTSAIPAYAHRNLSFLPRKITDYRAYIYIIFFFVKLFVASN